MALSEGNNLVVSYHSSSWPWLSQSPILRQRSISRNSSLYIYIYIYSPWNLQYIAIKFPHIDQHFPELDPIHATKKVTHESSIAGVVPHCQGGGGCQARPGKNMKQVRMVIWMNIISYPILSNPFTSYHIISVYMYSMYVCIYIHTEYICIYIYT